MTDNIKQSSAEDEMEENKNTGEDAEAEETVGSEASDKDNDRDGSRGDEKTADEGCKTGEDEEGSGGTGTDDDSNNENIENGEDGENAEKQDDAGIEDEESAASGDINTDWKDKYTRLYAEFQNFRRRVDREKSDIYQYANEKIALDIIEVLDNFDRAIAHVDEVEDKKFAEGVLLIHKQLKGVLDKNNIIEIEAEGKEFDPNFHNAVMTEENSDIESGFVIEALQKGYTLNSRVIRPVMVKVSQ